MKAVTTDRLLGRRTTERLPGRFQPRVTGPGHGDDLLPVAVRPARAEPNGVQLFAIQPDGTGLRQLTNARGFVQGEDRTAEVETVDYAWRYGPYQ